MKAPKILGCFLLRDLFGPDTFYYEEEKEDKKIWWV